MKFIIFFVFLFVFFGINSCVKPCAEFNQIPTTNLGNIPLNDSLYFLNHPQESNEIKFFSTKNKILTLKRIGDTIILSNKLFSGPKPSQYKCTESERSIYSANTLYEYNRFEGIEFPFEISLIRNNYNLSSIDSFIENRNWRFRDNASIHIKNNYVDLPPYAGFYKDNFQFLDSITLNKKVYKNVYHISDSSAVSDYRDDIYFKGVYYSYEKGILGFYFSDSETWLRK